MKPDLAGIYITDNHIDLAIGSARSATNVTRMRDAPFDLENIDQKRVWFDRHESVDEAFDEAMGWMVDRTRLRAIGIGCYGPFDLIHPAHRDNPDYGRVSNSGLLRKMAGRNIVDDIRRRLPLAIRSSVLITIDTDVNVAALGELYWRAIKDGHWVDGWQDQVIAFLKISVGIGGGIVRANETWQGRWHSEMGQIPVQLWNDPDEAAFAGNQPYGGLRLEALASTGAIRKRFGVEDDDRAYERMLKNASHPAWKRQAWYLAQLCLAVTAITAPSHIVLGGRVMNAAKLIEGVREQFRVFLSEKPYPWYPDIGNDDAGLASFISRDSEWTPETPFQDAYVGRPGIVGALCLGDMYSRPGASVRGQTQPRTLVR